ncbi:glycoside hydrolase family 25 protein [Flavobacterium arcticum]|uniref:Glycoside hydrolase family 25 protein n=1 Tax=Flavobacterium arcticum TaxID=1784713 RepID=A0A345H976_9FLAO|nr:glycoside hydrolase family 25 protein [Flavobacterium arcticum]AXG73136.1 glycoside hydrolase family 25 protein [Flavobacterium arcticum]KAF2512927.1 glycoside hydrolase family 25 protein [Flavobacterium arcticum]
MKRSAPPKKIVPPKKAQVKRKPVKKKKPSSVWVKVKWWSIILLVTTILIAGYQYRNGLLYYLGFKTDRHIKTLTKEERKLADLRIYEIVGRHKDKIFGIDVSEYQGMIDWNELQKAEEEFPLHFIFIRATAGKDKTDNKFKKNWRHSKENGYLRGAYHYYRPDENSILQADNFIKTVKLAKGDLPPVLDIERMPKAQSMESLKLGLQRWLDRVEQHYGVKPIIYSGESFYTDFLKKEFTDYSLWIANYSFFKEEIRKEWLFWQFTDKAQIKGIEGNVDVNIYNGNLEELIELVISEK